MLSKKQQCLVRLTQRYSDSCIIYIVEMLVVAGVENPALHSPEARQGWARREQVETKTAERANGSESIYKASRGAEGRGEPSTSPKAKQFCGPVTASIFGKLPQVPWFPLSLISETSRQYSEDSHTHTHPFIHSFTGSSIHSQAYIHTHLDSSSLPA